MGQAVVIDEPNSATNFTFGYSNYQELHCMMLTCDADRKVIPRAIIQNATNKSPQTWRLFQIHVTQAYPTLISSYYILKVDGAKSKWAVMKAKIKRISFRNHHHRSYNVPSKFGVKGKNTQQKIAKLEICIIGIV